MPVESTAHVLSVRPYVHEFQITVHEGPCVEERREVLASENGASVRRGGVRRRRWATGQYPRFKEGLVYQYPEHAHKQPVYYAVTRH
jgi:hypothetical protein